MRRFDDRVLERVEKGDLGASVSTPKNEHESPLLGTEDSNRHVSKRFPTYVPMATRFMGTHGENGVEQENPLLGPSLQKAVLRWGHPDVGLEFPVDVAEGWGDSYPMPDRESESMGLPRAVVGVLAEDDDPHVVKRHLEGTEDLSCRRVHDVRRSIGCHEVCELLEVGLLKLTGQSDFPRRMHKEAYTS